MDKNLNLEVELENKFDVEDFFKENDIGLVCPFRKITYYRNKYGALIEADKAVYTTEEFSSCLKEKCAMWSKNPCNY